MLPNLQFLADLVTFTEKIFNGKPHFLCSVNIQATHYRTELTGQVLDENKVCKLKKVYFKRKGQKIKIKSFTYHD